MQHSKGGHSGALQSSGMPDDFLSRSDSRSLERSTRVQPPVLPADSEWDNAISSHRHEKLSITTISSTAPVAVASSNTMDVPRTDFDDGNTSRGSSDVDAMPKNYKVRTEGLSSCARIRSSDAGASLITGEERLLRKQGTPSRPDVAGSVGSGILVSSTRQVGTAREMVSGSRRAAHNGSGPRRELVGSITRQRCTRRDVIDRSGLTSTSRSASNASGPKRGSRKKVRRDTEASYREDSKMVASSSVRSVTRASSHRKVPVKRWLRSTRVANTTCARMPVVDAKCMETSPSVIDTSEKEEFSRLLKAKNNELGLSDGVESSDALSGKLTASVLQELISALTNDTNTSAFQNSNYSDSSAALNNNETVYNSNDQSPDFQKCYQGDQEIDSSATCTNNEPNQPSPTSVLEACFSNDTSSLGSPIEKIEGKEFFVSIQNKMEDLFNLESDIVDLAMSIDKTKTDAEEIFHGSGKISCAQNFAARDFKFLEARIHSIGEVISNAELLLGSSLLCSTTSSLSLHSFIIEILETIVDVFGGSESIGPTEEKKYQHTNFLFNCIVESLNSKFCNFGKYGY